MEKLLGMQHNGIYRVSSVSHIQGENIHQRLIDLLDTTKRDNSDQRTTYYASPEEFLEAWISGYKLGEKPFGTNDIYETMGFELRYLNIDSESEFFHIGDHQGINSNGNRVAPFLLCADANEICDISGYMNVGVNDVRDMTVQVYRGLDQNRKNIPYSNLASKSITKHMRNEVSYYVWDFPENFPFQSANPLKASGSTWHMIGYSPLVVYQTLEKLGFVFAK